MVKLRSGFSVSASLLAAQSDERLVELFRRGHDGAFEALVLRYRGPLLAYGRRLLGDDRAEDVVQAALLKAYRFLEESDGAPAIRPWLYRVVHNGALDLLRRADAASVGLDDSYPSRHLPDDSVEHSERLRAAARVLSGLPQRQRDAFVLQELEGYSQQQIAARIGTSEGAVRQLVHRARGTLRAAACGCIPLPVLEALVRAPRAEAFSGRIAELVGEAAASASGAGGSSAAASGAAAVGASGAAAAGSGAVVGITAKVGLAVVAATGVAAGVAAMGSGLPAAVGDRQPSSAGASPNQVQVVTGRPDAGAAGEETTSRSPTASQTRKPPKAGTRSVRRSLDGARGDERERMADGRGSGGASPAPAAPRGEGDVEDARERDGARERTAPQERDDAHEHDDGPGGDSESGDDFEEDDEREAGHDGDEGGTRVVQPESERERNEVTRPATESTPAIDED